MSTRPDKAIGSDEIWSIATGALEEVLGVELPEELKKLEKLFPKPPGL